MIETSKSKVGYLALSLALGGAMAAGAAYGVDAMWVDTAGNVGVGTSTPQSKLHLNEVGPVGVTLENTTASNATKWEMRLQNSGSLVLDDTSNSDPNEMILTPAGDLTVSGDLWAVGGAVHVNAFATGDVIAYLNNSDSHAVQIRLGSDSVNR